MSIPRTDAIEQQQEAERERSLVKRAMERARRLHGDRLRQHDALLIRDLAQEIDKLQQALFAIASNAGLAAMKDYGQAMPAEQKATAEFTVVAQKVRADFFALAQRAAKAFGVRK